ncbi:MAG: hypothetical protein WCO52_00090 [bacterium]
MLNVLTTWYVTSASWFYASFLESVASVEATLAVRDTIKNLRKPLFQDYTLQGRAIGFGLRLVRIFIGGLAFFTLGVLYGIVYVVWLFFPIICIVSLIGSIFGAGPVVTGDGL